VLIRLDVRRLFESNSIHKSPAGDFGVGTASVAVHSPVFFRNGVPGGVIEGEEEGVAGAALGL
jgi:hypothetical protein